MKMPPWCCTVRIQQRLTRIGQPARSPRRCSDSSILLRCVQSSSWATLFQPVIAPCAIAAAWPSSFNHPLPQRLSWKPPPLSSWHYSRRIYKQAWSQQDPMDMLREKAGTQFDPTIVAAFLQLADQGDLDESS